jgi:hypothetical protein
MKRCTTKDEALYNKAKMLQWEKTGEFKNVVIMLGGFHTQMTFSKAIGKYLASSGICDMWSKARFLDKPQLITS